MEQDLKKRASEQPLPDEAMDIQRRKELFEYEMTEVRRMLEGTFKTYTAEAMQHAGESIEEKTMPPVQKIYTEENTEFAADAALPQEKHAVQPEYTVFEAEAAKAALRKLGSFPTEPAETEDWTVNTEVPGFRIPSLPAAEFKTFKTESAKAVPEKQRTLTAELKPVLPELTMPASAIGVSGEVTPFLISHRTEPEVKVTAGASRRLVTETAELQERPAAMISLPEKQTVIQKNVKTKHPEPAVDRLSAAKHLEQLKKNPEAERNVSVELNAPAFLPERDTLSVSVNAPAAETVTLRRLVLPEPEKAQVTVGVKVSGTHGFLPEKEDTQSYAVMEPAVIFAQPKKCGGLDVDAVLTELQTTEADRLFFRKMPEHRIAVSSVTLNETVLTPKKLKNMEITATAAGAEVVLPVSGTLAADAEPVETVFHPLVVTLPENGTLVCPELSGITVHAAAEAAAENKTLAVRPENPEDDLTEFAAEVNLPFPRMLGEAAGIRDCMPDMALFYVKPLSSAEEMIGQINALREEIMMTPKGLSYEELCRQCVIPTPRLEIKDALTEIMELFRKDFEEGRETADKTTF